MALNTSSAISVVEEIDTNSVRNLISFLNLFGKPYYVYAGFALYLRGFSDAELDDIDVKVFHDDIRELYFSASKFFNCDVRIVNSVIGSFGSYLFPYRVEIDSKTPADLCTRTGAEADFGQFEFPFSKKAYENIDYFSYSDVKISVASLEQIFLYYLILRRGISDNKSDERKVRAILDSGRFEEKKFYELIEDHPLKNNAIALYRSYLRADSR